MSSIRVFSPATVANVACGFDILGFALEAPGDEIELRLLDKPGITIVNHILGMNIPLDPSRNTAGVALQTYIDHLELQQGFEIIFHDKIKPGSGIGSSSASAAAAVFAANELMNRPLPRIKLVEFAMQGERAASGSAHADNVAPALLGGFVLIRSYLPLDIIQLPYPQELYAAVVHPHIEVRTEDARRILKKQISMKVAIAQWGNVAGLVAGLAMNDMALIGRSLQDGIVEPVRSLLIPGYDRVKAAAMDAGALGGSISGSGPSVFALCADKATATKASIAMGKVFDSLQINSNIYVSAVNKEGVKVV
jgi:homoserine kinase